MLRIEIMKSYRNAARGVAEKALYAAGHYPTSALTLPDFLGIGAVKAGTTWLHRNLFRHPELCVAIKKPVWYFDQNFARPLTEYAAIFAAAGERRKGELTASYSTLPLWKILFLRRIMPELRLILILREPVSRDWSDIRMELNLFRKVPKESWTDKLLLEVAQSEKIRRQGDYRRIIKNWQAVFPRQQIYLGIFEEMVSEPKRILTDIFRFLGVSEEVDWSGFPTADVVFEGVPAELPARIRDEIVRRHDAREMADLCRMLDRDLRPFWPQGCTR